MSNDRRNSLIAKLVKPEVQAMAAYHVADARGMVKLDAMENPYAWPQSLKSPLAAALAAADVNRYPDAQASAVKLALRKAMQLDAGHEVVFGNGSDEIIQMLALALGRPGATILSVEPAFVMYKVIAAWLGLKYVGVPLTPDFALDEAVTLAAVAEHKPALVFLALPNNPTGNVFDQRVVEQIIAATPGLVVIDEAYLPFTDSNLLPLINRFDNVVVMRTLSKVGLAGLRLGMLIGPPEWLHEIDKVRLPYNVNVLTQQAALVALDNYDQFLQQAALLRAQRAELFAALQEIPQLKVWPSEANFITLRTLALPARDVFADLKSQGVLIKCLDGAHPLLGDCLRVTVSTPDENARFLAALRQALNTH
jgi:histidinol-phosphate aminotransferase